MYETQYRFSGRLVYPRPWSESYHKLHKFNPSIETAYITMRKTRRRKFTKTKKKRKASCINVPSPYFLTIQSAHSYSLIYTSSNHMNLKKTIAEIKSRKTTDRRVGDMYVTKSINANHEDLIHDVAYDFYGKRMATCSSDQKVKVWDQQENGEWVCSARSWI